jgi:hypothetical protein
MSRFVHSGANHHIGQSADVDGAIIHYRTLRPTATEPPDPPYTSSAVAHGSGRAEAWQVPVDAFGGWFIVMLALMFKAVACGAITAQAVPVANATA